MEVLLIWICINLWDKSTNMGGLVLYGFESIGTAQWLLGFKEDGIVMHESGFCVEAFGSHNMLCCCRSWHVLQFGSAHRREPLRFGFPMDGGTVIRYSRFWQGFPCLHFVQKSSRLHTYLWSRGWVCAIGRARIECWNSLMWSSTFYWLL